MSITVEQAVGLIQENTAKLGAVSAPLEECAGRVLTEDVTAAISQPPFPRSPLDGYAVRAADTRNASKERPAVLRVVSKYYAGDNAVKPVHPGEASRIMTGSMLPDGADCVVRQEDTDEGEQTVQIFRAHKTNENYVCRGEDFQAGAKLLAAGTVLDAAAVAVAAAAGRSALSVIARPRVSIISTGDELTESGQPLLPGKIYDSNLYYLRTRLRELGAEIIFCRVAGDELALITNAVSEAAKHSDLVLTTGGVSVGQKDLLPAVLEELGAEVIFQGVRMKPGMPTTFSRLGDARILCLSGNPFAAAVAFEVLARPCLYAMTSGASFQTEYLSAVMDTPFEKASPSGRFVRGMYKNGHVQLPEGHSNGQMRSMVGCNCLVALAPGSGSVAQGQTVEVMIL